MVEHVVVSGSRQEGRGVPSNSEECRLCSPEVELILDTPRREGVKHENLLCRVFQDFAEPGNYLPPRKYVQNPSFVLCVACGLAFSGCPSTELPDDLGLVHSRSLSSRAGDSRMSVVSMIECFEVFVDTGEDAKILLLQEP